MPSEGIHQPTRDATLFYILLLDIDDLCQENILVSCGSSICTTSSSYKNETETATTEIGLHGTIVASHQLGTNQIETSVNEFSRSMCNKGNNNTADPGIEN